jgi:hypothetical protein
MPREPGDHAESVRFTASDGAATSLPEVRRTLIPPTAPSPAAVRDPVRGSGRAVISCVRGTNAAE